MDFGVITDLWVKMKESEKRYKYVDLARELKKTMEHKSDSKNNYNRSDWHNPQWIGKETRRLRNQRTRSDHPDYSITKIG